MVQRPANYYQLTIVSSSGIFTGIRAGEWYAHRAPALYAYVQYCVYARNLKRHRRCWRTGGRFISPASNRPYASSELPPEGMVTLFNRLQESYEGLADTWLSLRITGVKP